MNTIFQQDTASTHTEALTKTFDDDQPALSTDLNRIENPWAIVSLNAYDRSPPEFQTKAELKPRIVEAWEKL